MAKKEKITWSKAAFWIVVSPTVLLFPFLAAVFFYLRLFALTISHLKACYCLSFAWVMPSILQVSASDPQLRWGFPAMCFQCTLHLSVSLITLWTLVQCLASSLNYKLPRKETVTIVFTAIILTLTCDIVGTPQILVTQENETTEWDKWMNKWTNDNRVQVLLSPKS